MEPLVHRLGYIALNVSDLDGAVEDARQIAGAALVDKTPERALLTSNARHAELILHRAERSSLRMIGLETLQIDHVDEVARRARAAGLPIVSEITNANDPKESGEQVEASRENGRSNGPPSVRGKAESRIPQRVATVISWGMCWHFQ